MAEERCRQAGGKVNLKLNLARSVLSFNQKFRDQTFLQFDL